MSKAAILSTCSLPVVVEAFAPGLKGNRFDTQCADLPQALPRFIAQGCEVAQDCLPAAPPSLAALLTSFSRRLELMIT